MKRIICMLLVLSSISVFSQKEFKVISLKQISSDISARTNQREDPKGEACALVKVQIPMRDVLFDGDIIGEIAYKTNEYWVYMPEKSSHLLINKAGYSPLNIDFKKYDIPVLESKGTYELCLLEKQVGAPQLYNEGMIALAQNDMITAFDKLQSAADAGYGMAYYQLGNMQIQPYEDKYEDPNTTETYQTVYDYYKKAVDAGVPEALFALGVFIQKYNDTKSFVANAPDFAKNEPNIYKVNIPKELCEPNKAIEMIREAANKGIIEAQYMMLGDDQWCEENADKGIAVAQFGMGLRNDSELPTEEYRMLENTIYEISSSENFAKAAEWYQKAAENGLDVAQWRLAELYARGLGIEENINKAIELRSKAAEQGNFIFQLIMGIMYAWGQYSDYAYGGNGWNYYIDIPINIDEADKWLRKANYKQFYETNKLTYDENLLFPEAMNKTAEGFINESRYERAIYWYQRLADMGYTDALCNLGKIYFINKNYQKAKALFEKVVLDEDNCVNATEEYEYEALCYLGVIYRDGLGVEIDRTKALDYLMLSTDEAIGPAISYYELGNFYYTENKYDEAFKYYEKTASHSYDQTDGKYTWFDEVSTKAYCKLGLMYEAGQGIEKNPEKAVEYLTEAASRGSDEAKKYLQERNLPIPSQKLGRTLKRKWRY